MQKYGFLSEIEIVVPNPTLYNALEQGHSDLEKLRRKLFLDVIYWICLHLEDDLDPGDNFLCHIEIFRKEISAVNWIILEYIPHWVLWAKWFKYSMFQNY